MSTDGTKRYFTVKEIADLAGVSTSTLRAWERRFSIFSPERTQGGHRLYTLDDLKLLWYIRRQQTQGKDLKQISNVGREILLQQALLYFDPETLPDQGIPVEQDKTVLDALAEGRLDVALRQVDDFCKITQDPAELAELALRLSACLRAASEAERISVAARRSLMVKLRHELMAHASRPLEAENEDTLSVFCVSLAHDEYDLSLLRNAIHLRQLGYRVIYFGSGLGVEELHEFVVRAMPRIVCLGIDFTEEPWMISQTFQSVALRIAPHVLTVVVPLENSQNSQLPEGPESRYLYLARDLTDFRRFASNAQMDRRAPVLVMSDFKRSCLAEEE